MRKLALRTLLAALPLAALAATPATAGGPVETTILQHSSCGIDHPDDLCVYYGFVDSDNQKCISGRKVKIYRYVDTGGSPELELIDTAKTSRHGGFAGVGLPSDVSAAKAKALKRIVGSGANRVVCKAATYNGA
jgi:hypothetical protein